MEVSEKDDFVQYCIRNYKVPYFSLNEFKHDLSTVTNIKKMLSRYLTSGKLNYRLLLNHVITLNNCFGVDSTNIILFYKLENKFHYAIKSTLLYLNIYVQTDLTNMIEIDQNLLKLLRNTD